MRFTEDLPELGKQGINMIYKRRFMTVIYIFVFFLEGTRLKIDWKK